MSISARALPIIWGNTPEYWNWIPNENSLYVSSPRESTVVVNFFCQCFVSAGNELHLLPSCLCELYMMEYYDDQFRFEKVSAAFSK